MQLIKHKSFLLGSLLYLFTFAVAHPADLQQKFTNRCDELCAAKDLSLQEDLKPDCQRGCQYFNIQFLISASDKAKVTDLKTTETECTNSCGEAYSLGLKRHACNTGCAKMTELQARAPYINGWLVYMGASDRSMVLLQPDYDIPSEDDWILLDSVLRSNDYDKFLEQYKISENHFQTMSITPSTRKHLDLKNCFPTWKWMILILMLFGFLWMRYLTFLNITLTDARENVPSTPYTTNDDSTAAILKAHDKHIDEQFLISNDTYFYPSPVVPPPKYDEAIEAMLHTSGIDDEIVLATDIPNVFVASNTTACDTAIPKIVTTEGNSIKI